MAVRVAAVNNQVGLQAIGGGAAIWVGQSTISGNNSTFLASNGAVVQSFGDNYIKGNSNGDTAPNTIAKN